MDFVNEFDKIIYEVSSVLGKFIDKEKYQIVDRRMPHQPKSLPQQKMGVYTFWHNGKFIKIGKAEPKSNPRFESQHYNPKSSKINLAASILSDERMKDKDITENNIGDWIKNNCRRVDILLDSDLGIFSLELIEVALHYKYEPIYEGFVTQR
ncbi:hypothetical protein HYH96_08275 [Clostridium botulinum]|uniref:hypothetical protein n=1 Tax=Clostridium botulinum TaxID=1491 RepID=UPI00174E0A58|nr:hypothetical protein [Clostridium botulinum]MBD5643893.1 hypothetical protein [Clostridium botulinum]